MITRLDFGHGQYLMLTNVSGIRSIYDTDTKEDLDIKDCKGGVMGNFCKEGTMALFRLQTEVESLGGKFRVSDMYRDWMMQAQAHHDYLSKKKTAYSPPPGFSCHEAGRSIDFDTALIQETLNPSGFGKSGFDLFWEISRENGFTGVRENRKKPVYTASEAWHIDYMGIFRSVYHNEGYKKMAMVSIMDAIGDNYPGYESSHIRNVRIQGYLLGLGLYRGSIDGIWGGGSKRALNAYFQQPDIKNAYFDMVLEHYNISADGKHKHLQST